MTDDYADLTDIRVCCQQCGIPIDTAPMPVIVDRADADDVNVDGEYRVHFCSDECYRKSQVPGTRIE